MQHRGFVQGFVVCYVNLVDRKTFRESFQAYNLRLNAYLKAHPEASSESLNILLPRLAAPPYAHPVHKSLPGNESPEEVNQKWGAHEDGDDWRGGSSWNLGFIQGFLNCYSNDTKQAYGNFSKSDEWYVSAISEWYGTKEGDPEIINLKRENEKIPEVLFRFRDKSQ